MRSLLWMFEGDVPGGHRVQLEKTAKALRDLGVEVETHSGEPPAGLNNFDVVHGFGLLPAQARACREAGVPLALSTIYWSRAYTTNMLRSPWSPGAFKRNLRLAVAFSLATLRGHYLEKIDALAARWDQQRLLYETADLLLPNSVGEGAQVVADLGVTTPQHVVPNGVDAASFPLASGPREGVLYVGRFEPHKNQLGLIRAMRGSGIPLTIMGPPHRHHQAYYEQCVREAGAEVKILGPVPHDELGPFYSAYKVHVLPSWFETTGLVSLEAALTGCNIVTTDRGFAPEYFGKLAWYCNPYQPATIREAVAAAYAAPYRAELRELIISRYTWRHTAEETVAAYEKIIRPRRAYAARANAAAVLEPEPQAA